MKYTVLSTTGHAFNPCCRCDNHQPSFSHIGESALPAELRVLLIGGDFVTGGFITGGLSFEDISPVEKGNFRKWMRKLLEKNDGAESHQQSIFDDLVLVDALRVPSGSFVAVIAWRHNEFACSGQSNEVLFDVTFATLPLSEQAFQNIRLALDAYRWKKRKDELVKARVVEQGLRWDSIDAKKKVLWAQYGVDDETVEKVRALVNAHHRLSKEAVEEDINKINAEIDDQIQEEKERM